MSALVGESVELTGGAADAVEWRAGVSEIFDNEASRTDSQRELRSLCAAAGNVCSSNGSLPRVAGKSLLMFCVACVCDSPTVSANGSPRSLSTFSASASSAGTSTSLASAKVARQKSANASKTAGSTE